MELLSFLGQSEEDITRYCQERQIPYKVVMTRDPRAAEDSATENRIIRLNWDQDTLVILIACFAQAVYKKATDR